MVAAAWLCASVSLNHTQNEEEVEGQLIRSVRELVERRRLREFRQTQYPAGLSHAGSHRSLVKSLMLWTESLVYLVKYTDI